jgi:hypothetical protein
LRALIASLYADGEPLAENNSAAEWATILTAMGASPDEIAEVQARMGRAGIYASGTGTSAADGPARRATGTGPWATE